MRNKTKLVLLSILTILIIALYGGSSYFINKLCNDVFFKNEIYYFQNTKNTSAESIIVNEDVIVYITKYGEKYHREHCRYLRKSKEEIMLTTAKNQNYTPCSICYP